MGVREALNPPEARKVPERTRGRPEQAAAGPSRQSLPPWSSFSRKPGDHGCPRSGVQDSGRGSGPGALRLATTYPSRSRAPPPTLCAHGWKKESAPGSETPRKSAGSYMRPAFGGEAPTPKLARLGGFEQGHGCGFRRAPGQVRPSPGLRTMSCPPRELRRLQRHRTSDLQRGPWKGVRSACCRRGRCRPCPPDAGEGGEHQVIVTTVSARSRRLLPGRGREKAPRTEILALGPKAPASPLPS